MELKQQLELMKMCGKVNKNPTLANNPNFKLLVSKCSGIVIPDDKIIKPDGSYWDSIKDDYKKENPDVKLVTHKFNIRICLLYTSPSPRDGLLSRMPSSA